jgi:hypothetical protein
MAGVLTATLWPYVHLCAEVPSSVVGQRLTGYVCELHSRVWPRWLFC